MKCIFAIVMALAVWTGGLMAEGGVIVFNAVDSGWYDNGGEHQSNHENYAAGNASDEVFRNWFVFDISGLASNVVAATLQISNPPGGYESSDPAEFYAIFDVTTDTSTLRMSHASGNPEGVSIFNDLGSGVQYGGRSVSTLDNNTIVSFSLNPDAVAAINAAATTFAIGGRLTTLDGDNSNRELFTAFTTSGNLTRQLVVETLDAATVPETSSLIVWSSVIGVLAILLWLHRKQQILAVRSEANTLDSNRIGAVCLAGDRF